MTRQSRTDWPSSRIEANFDEDLVSALLCRIDWEVPPYTLSGCHILIVHGSIATSLPHCNKNKRYQAAAANSRQCLTLGWSKMTIGNLSCRWFYHWKWSLHLSWSAPQRASWGWWRRNDEEKHSDWTSASLGSITRLRSKAPFITKEMYRIAPAAAAFFRL